MKLPKVIQRTHDLLISWLESWGMRSRTTAKARSGVVVGVHLTLPSGEDVHVGSLTRDGEEYVFVYTPQFTWRTDLRPIGAFPVTSSEYRSRTLWPFFEVRMPRVGRDDVKTAIVKEKIDPSDELQLLGRLGARSVSSPYELTFEPAPAIWMATEAGEEES